MTYASSATYLLTRLQQKFSRCEPKEEWAHVGLYNYNGSQIELFHMKWALVDVFYEMPDFGAGVQNFLYEQA